MKEKILAVILFAVTIIFVTVNTIIIDRQITDVIDDVEDLDLGAENSIDDAHSIYEDFMKKQGVGLWQGYVTSYVSRFKKPWGKICNSFLAQSG